MNKNVALVIIILIIFSLVGLAFYGNAVGNKHHKAIIEMEDGRQIVVELYQDVAPETVANFISLANAGFYDGLTFHRIIDGFMIQGGDPEGTGTGGSGQTITGEFINNGYENYLSHKEGTISMARGDDYNSASSQFFITVADRTELDGNYAAFGRVIEGSMDVVMELSKLETTTTEDGIEDMPVNPPVIKTIKIEKYAINYDNTNEYDKAEMESLLSTDDSESFSIEELYYEMYEAEGYTRNDDGTLTDTEGNTYTLEELINESYYTMLEADGYTRNDDGTVTSPDGKTSTLEEALNELYASTEETTTEETTAE